jgi:hypothetical protein
MTTDRNASGVPLERRDADLARVGMGWYWWRERPELPALFGFRLCRTGSVWVIVAGRKTFRRLVGVATGLCSYLPAR